MTAPNLEERFSAAAFTILTDGNAHTQQARRWAERTLQSAARGKSTAFQRRVRSARVRAFAGSVQ
jgi:hypothetical protein